MIPLMLLATEFMANTLFFSKCTHTCSHQVTGMFVKSRLFLPLNLFMPVLFAAVVSNDSCHRISPPCMNNPHFQNWSLFLLPLNLGLPRVLLWPIKLQQTKLAELLVPGLSLRELAAPASSLLKTSHHMRSLTTLRPSCCKEPQDRPVQRPHGERCPVTS